MNNDFESYKKQQTIRWIVVSILLIVLFAGMIAAIVPAYSNKNSNNEFKNEISGTEIFEEVAHTENISLAFLNTSTMRMAAKAATATDGVVLEATVKPDAAADKSVDWSISFVNPTSTWARGKNPSSYVTVTPTSDGAATATVKSLQAFGEQIKITVTSRQNPSATADCIVDYSKKLADVAEISFIATNAFATGNSISSSGINIVQTIVPANWQLLAGKYGASFFYFDPEYSNVFTKDFETAPTVVLSVKPSTEFYNALKTQGIARASNDWVELPVESASENGRGYANGSLFDSLCSVTLVPASGYNQTIYDNIDKFNKAIISCSGTQDLQIKVVATTPYETKEYVFNCKFDHNNAAFSVKTVEVNSSIVF